MKFEILGTTLPVVEVTLDQGEVLYSEAGAMAWMEQGISLEAQTGGKGVFGMLGRALSGESLFLTYYTAQRNGVKIAFGVNAPGKIIARELGPGEQLICQKKSFLAAERSVQLDIMFQHKLGVGLFGGEGFILQKVTGPGWVFLEVDGEVVEKVLGPGEVLKVDNGYLAFAEPTVSVDIETVKGFRNILFGGEGLFLAVLRGPGKVALQTLPINVLAASIIPFVPVKK
ncbi:MAG: TIGR00266 family protein [Bacillota bacterium]